MERTMIDRRSVMLLGSGFATGLAATRVMAAESAGRVTTLTGTARASKAAIERTLAAGHDIGVGDLVQTDTGSRLGLMLGKDTRIMLGPSARLLIESHLVDAGGQFELVEGSMYFEHTRPRGTAPKKADVRSPYGLIAVRGTKFFAGFSEGNFGVFVAEGRVDVTSAQRTVVLHPGFGTEIARPGAAPAPARVWPAARIRKSLLLTTGRTDVPK